MPSPPDRLLRQAADRHLHHAEQDLETVVVEAVDAWLTACRYAIISTLIEQRGLTAAGLPEAAVDAALQAWHDWRRQVDNNLLPAVAVQFGDAFQQTRLENRDTGSFGPQMEFMEQVADRLRIWPEGAFEDLRPELVEALAAAETIEQITDRVGMVLGIDVDQRAIKARIVEVEKALDDPDGHGLDKLDVAELRAERRALWGAHDEEETKWRWKARRIARTESHAAVEAGTLAAARQNEADTGQVWFKRWLATDDPRTRVSHRVADGQTVPLSEKFRVGGFLLDHPGDPLTIAPHEVVNCRCTLLIYPPNALQDALQGPDGSMGEVRPEGVRIGPDDPDVVEQAIVDVAARESRALPDNPGARGEDHGQTVPAAPVAVALTDHRDLPINEVLPDLSTYTDDDLLDLMAEKVRSDDGMYEQVLAEYDRRQESGDSVEEPARPAVEADAEFAALDDDELLDLMEARLGADDGSYERARDEYDQRQAQDDLFDSPEPTERQSSAVDRWQSTDRFYDQVQALARGTEAEVDEEIAEVYDELAELVADSEVAKDLVAWRGNRNASRAVGIPASELESLIGTERIAPGFFAASLAMDIAVEEFTRPSFGGGAFLMKVHIRRGTAAAWIAALGRQAMRYQLELLLLAPLVRYLEVDRSDPNLPVLICEVVI